MGMGRFRQCLGRFTLNTGVGGDDGGEEEVSLTSLASPSNWQKLDLLALSLTTVTSRRVGAAGGGGRGGGGGGGCTSSGGDGWASCRRLFQASRLAASRAWRPGPR